MKHSDYHTLCDALSKTSEIFELGKFLYSDDIIIGMTKKRAKEYKKSLHNVMANLPVMQSFLIKSKYEDKNHD